MGVRRAGRGGANSHPEGRGSSWSNRPKLLKGQGQGKAIFKIGEMCQGMNRARDKEEDSEGGMAVLDCRCSPWVWGWGPVCWQLREK